MYSSEKFSLLTWVKSSKFLQRSEMCELKYSEVSDTTQRDGSNNSNYSISIISVFPLFPINLCILYILGLDIVCIIPKTRLNNL